MCNKIILLLATFISTFGNEPMETYLYKILSYQNWQASQAKNAIILSAEDVAFIHLSTEEQLQRILAKYWKGAPQVVLLKLKTDKFQGKLVLEANPGGKTKYYHLYEGFIPFSAIVEAKVIFNEPPEEKGVLPIVKFGNPILRQNARELTHEEILSPSIQQLILEMQATMRKAPGVGLAAPQIGKPYQLAVIEDMNHAHLTEEELLERDRKKVPFHVIINPKIFLDNSEITEFFEGCLSFPGALGIVPRAKSVRVECLNEHAQPVTIEATGWYARILQHEVDHLNAGLFIDRAYIPSIMTDESYNELWKGQSVEEILNKLFVHFIK